MKKLLKVGLLLVFCLFILLGIMAYLVMGDINSENIGSFKFKAKLFSKSTIMSTYDSYKNYFYDDYGSNPLDEDYCLENLEHPYFEEIRNDERLSKFYGKDTYNLEDYILMREYLRDKFPHGTSSKSYFGYNLIELLNAAEKGENFLCNNISKMLCQMIMASGTYARVIRISDEESNGHVVMEYWDKNRQKWVLLDVDYNVHYTSLSDSIPLNGIELVQMSMTPKPLVKHKGVSVNTLFSETTELYENFYRNGIAVDFYNQWVSKNHERKNPLRSPANSCIYIGTHPYGQMYFKYDYSVDNDSIINLVYGNPFEYDNQRCKK